MISDILFIVGTFIWCQAMPLRLLAIYAASVALTFTGKVIWVYWVK